MFKKTRTIWKVCVCNLMWTQSHPPSQRSYQTQHTLSLELSFSWALICFSIVLSLFYSHTLKQTKEKTEKICFYIFVCLCFSQSIPCWETDSKISCEQTLQKGEGPKTSWTREITNDGELILVRFIHVIMCYPCGSYTHIGLWSYFSFFCRQWPQMMWCAQEFISESESMRKQEENPSRSLSFLINHWLWFYVIYFLFPSSLLLCFFVDNVFK